MSCILQSSLCSFQTRCSTVSDSAASMALPWSCEGVPGAQELSLTYAPSASPTCAFRLLTSGVCAAPDGFLSVFFSTLAAERIALKQAYTYVSFAFLSMLEKQRFQARRDVKPHLPQLCGVRKLLDVADLGDLQRWLYFLHPRVAYRNVAVANVCAGKQPRCEALTSGFYKKQMEVHWYFQAHGASALDILYMRYDYASAHWISEYAFYELSK